MGTSGRGPTNTPPRTVHFSHAHCVHLQERVDGARGNYTTVSVLDPFMRIERTKALWSEDPSKDPEAKYRIVLTFRLQVEIIDFDRGQVVYPTILGLA
jgi:hypothetical protein